MSLYTLMHPGETVQKALDRLASELLRKSTAPLAHHDAVMQIFREHRALYDAYHAEASGHPLPTPPPPRRQNVVHVLPGETAAHVMKRCLGATPTPEETTQFFRENPGVFAQYGREMASGDRE